LLLASSFSKAAADWSRDGRVLLYSSNDPKNLWDLWVLPFDADGKAQEPNAFLTTAASECCGQFSPDGRWIAYQSTLSGAWEIYVRPFPNRDAEWLISSSGGTQPRWSSDGKELFYVAPDSALMAVSVNANGEALRAGPPIRLFQPRICGYANPVSRQQFDVSSDNRFLVNVTIDDEASVPITLLLNWRPPGQK
jgi:Tol biopolymer transport system component